MAAVRWEQVRFTEHMTEAAAVVGECEVVLDFGPAERVAYTVRVYAALKGGGDPYFAVGTNRDDPGAAFRPVAAGATAEAALQACLDGAGIHHRRRVKQAGEVS